MSQQLATINTKAPIEIGLDDTLLKGKKVDELSQFYDEMGFAQFKSKLLAEAGGEVTDEKVVDEIDFEIVTDGSISEKVNADDFFYLETLRENYHREQIVAFAWGNAEKIYVSKNIDLLTK